MRKILLIFVLIFFYSCQDADINDVSKRNENWVYWIDKESGKASWVPVAGNETTLKNGRYTRFYTSGTIYQRGKLKNGKDIDTIYFYDLNEKPIQYLLVKSDTMIHYYVNNGPYLSNSQDGKIFEKGIVENHKIGNEWTKYFDNGKIDWTKKLVNGTGWNYWYYKNGQMSDMDYRVNGKTSGEVKIWYENGQIKEISHWKNGVQNDSYETYYENGKPKEKANWKDDKLDGKRESWYENGQKKQLEFYNNGTPDGQVEQWYANGSKKAIINFVSGKVEGKVISYYENGIVKSQGYLKDGNAMESFHGITKMEH